MNANWYDVLDVEPTATADEIRTAWRAAVADLDPTDRRFRVYNQAAEVLLDPAKRAAYDAELERGRSDAAEPRGNDRSETEAHRIRSPDESGATDGAGTVDSIDTAAQTRCRRGGRRSCRPPRTDPQGATP
jgi:Mce-associated membrane protein